MNPTDATLASLSIKKIQILKMASKMAVSLAPKTYMINILDKKHFNIDFL